MGTASKILWTANQKDKEQSNISHYINWLKIEKNLSFSTYQALWEWSVADTSAFWESLWQYFDVISHSPYTLAQSDAPMPRTKWFEGATLNYAEHIFRNKNQEFPALIFSSERQKPTAISWENLEEQTAALQAFLRKEGVGKNDAVAAYIPNIPQATVGLLASISLGAIWSSCSPDFGAESVLDRFRQIKPKVLLAVDGYVYGDKLCDRTQVVKELQEKLPSVEKVILIPYLNTAIEAASIPKAILWSEVMATPHAEMSYEAVPFSHPIWVLYSSGTTGLPKAITHSHGGMLLEHLKYLSLHNDVKRGEKFFWFSTTGWMMWNFVQASLLVGATAVLFDGNPGYPDLTRLWRLAEQVGIHHFGTSAPFILACKKQNLQPGKDFDLSTLRSIGSTGSPLPPEGFDYVYNKIKSDVWLCSMSGGTDICTAWVGSCILKPLVEGEIQCRALGVAMQAYDEQGHPIYGEVGEMVVTKPLPCMPIYFWGDEDFKRYTTSYFEMYPGLWRHGDWIEITENKGVIIFGRSDATLNRQGVRIGTSEIYRALAPLEEIKDALIVNLEQANGKSYMPLFVVLNRGAQLDEELKKKINSTLRKAYSPRHVPEAIVEAPDLPYTISGKKMEAPVKKILMGKLKMSSTQKGAMKNPEALDFFIQYAKKLANQLE